MKKAKVTKKFRALSFIAFAILLSTLVSCGPLMQKSVPDSGKSSYDIDSSKQLAFLKETIPPYNTLYFSDGQGYEFKRNYSNKLLITLDGGPGWNKSRIGIIGGDLAWGRFVDWLLPLYGDYNIFVPEKFDWGRNVDPFWDINNRAKYTVDNLILCYESVIKEYLSQNNFDTIILAGFSEGGIIVPELYLRFDEFVIAGLISIGAGGLVSPYDIAAARRKEPLEDESIEHYLKVYNQYVEAYGQEGYVDSPDEERYEKIGGYLIRGDYMTWMWRYSIDARRPFELYKDISIPVLFIHGQLDANVSVIATRYVEENLPSKPFNYIYYPDMIHYPETVGQLKRLRADIADWLREKGL